MKAHGKGGDVETWLFQAMLLRWRGEHEEAIRLLGRAEERRRTETFLTWQDRVRRDVLLRKARTVVHTPPPMPTVAVGE